MSRFASLMSQQMSRAICFVSGVGNSRVTLICSLGDAVASCEAISQVEAIRVSPDKVREMTSTIR